MSEENEFQGGNKTPEEEREKEKDNYEKPKDEKPTKKGRADFYVELILFLVLGILVGISLKTEAAKKLTIGYNDYKMKIMKQDYDINKLQKDLIKKNQEAASQQSNTQGDSTLPD